MGEHGLGSSAEGALSGRVLASRLAVIVTIGLSSWCLLAYWHRASPTVPIWDGWFWIDQAKVFEEGGFTQLFRERHPFVYSDHIYFLPAMLSLALGPFVGFSARPFALLSVLGLIACGLIFYAIARRSGVGRAGALATCVSVASFRHWENMLLGFQVGFPMCVIFGSLALYVADARRTRWGLIAAIALGVCCALSSSGGLPLLIALILVLWFDPFRPMRGVLIGLLITIFSLTVHLGLLAVYDVSFVGDATGKYTLERLPEIIEHTMMLLGGALVGGTASLPVGIALAAGSCAVIAVQIRSTRRIDALSGLAIWSLLNMLIIAGARFPFEAPASRHELFAAPALAVCVIGLYRWLSTAPRVLLPASVAVFVGLAWSTADNYLDAVEYEETLGEFDLRTRCHVLAQANGKVLTNDELKEVYPFEVRSLIQYTIDRRWTIFSGEDNSFEFHRDLPSRVFGAASGNVVNGVLELTGVGHMYEDYPCPYPEGCAVQVSADVEALGTSTVGIILVGPAGLEYENINVLVPLTGTFTHISVRAVAKPGSTIRPYVFSAGPQDRVRVRHFSVGILKYAFKPRTTD